jgi:hypothetical protein
VKGPRDPPFSILHTFYKKKVLMALQHAQVISILSRAIVVEGSSKLRVLSRVLPFYCLIWFSRQAGVQELDDPGCLPSFGGSSWTWVLPFYSLYFPVFGCFDLFMVGRVSSNTIEVSVKS